MSAPRTSINDAREAIYQHFVANWASYVAAEAARQSVTLAAPPYALGDETLDPPNGLWVRLTVRHGPTSQETLGTCGNRNFDRSAIAFVQGFMTPGGDERTLDVCMEAARNLFEGRTIAPIEARFNAVEVSELGVIEGGRWQAALADAPFNYATRK